MELADRVRKHPWRTLVLAVLAVVVLLTIALASIVPFRSESAHRRIVAALSEHLQSDVQLGDLQWRVLPQLRAEGGDLVIRHKGRTDVPPLISVKRFSVEGNIVGLLRRRVSLVTLEGLDIQIPPRGQSGEPRNDEAQPSRPSQGAEPPGTDQPEPRAEKTEPPRASGENPARAFTIDTMITTDGRLAVVSSRPDREPKAWAIHHLEMRTLGFTRTMPFTATVTNAIPSGQVEMAGTFGPWAAGDPGESPISGDYTFADADLSVFKGIAGILSAKGSMTGSIDRIETRGETTTPDFMIRPAGHAVPVKASYQAIVDATNGNTVLDRVNITFLDTALVATGAIVKTPGEKGRTLTIDVEVEKGRLEDIMRLVVKAPAPPMHGALELTAALKLPPGEPDVLDRMQLDGQFRADGTTFTDAGVQKQINELSLRARGKIDEARPRQVGSDFAGRFTLRSGTLRIPAVAFNVPGAIVRLSGTYELERETIDFSGTLLMEASVSETATGFKSLLLKIVDPLFKRPGGGSAVPIAISGTRDSPKFGVDKGRIFKRK